MVIGEGYSQNPASQINVLIITSCGLVLLEDLVHETDGGVREVAVVGRLGKARQSSTELQRQIFKMIPCEEDEIIAELDGVDFLLVR